MSEELGVAKNAWKFFLKAHADECDTDATVDEIVAKTADLTRKEIVEWIREWLAGYGDNGLIFDFEEALKQLGEQ